MGGQVKESKRRKTAGYLTSFAIFFVCCRAAGRLSARRHLTLTHTKNNKRGGWGSLSSWRCKKSACRQTRGRLTGGWILCFVVPADRHSHRIQETAKKLLVQKECAPADSRPSNRRLDFCLFVVLLFAPHTRHSHLTRDTHTQPATKESIDGLGASVRFALHVRA